MTMRSPIEQMVDRACGISPTELQRMQQEAKELEDKQTRALLAVEKAARGWWLTKRPVGWKRSQHLANPTVNCTDAKEKALAHSVAKWVKLGG